MRGRNLIIILICFITFITFWGCGGGGGSGIGPELVSGQISGQITFDESIANERAVIASDQSHRGSVNSDILVFLEEMPSRAVYADSDGKYIFTDLPLDTSYHVIARINSPTGTVYKTRSEEVYIGKSKAQKTQNFLINSGCEAKYQIRLQVKDTKDNNVSRCKIWLWGEEFTLDESGCYLSPKMPLGASGLLKVIPPTNKDLLTLESTIDSSTFQSEIQGVSAVTLPPSGITQKKAPYVSVKVGETISGGFALRLYGSAIDPQNDTLELEWTTSIGSFTFESTDKSYVDWAIPTEQTTAVITLKATQVSSSLYPLFWSKVELPITISNNGTVSYPGEIVIKPVLRYVEIVSSSSEQITGDTVASYEIIASFPNNNTGFAYNWEVSDGTIVSGKNSRVMFWKSPSLKENESKLATLTAIVSDEIATVTKDLLISITSFPIVSFTSPLTTDFYPGYVTFRGSAKDYLGNLIPYEDFKWYIATDSNELKLIQNEGASFTYNFVSQGSYTVYLSAKDSRDIVGTGSMIMSILNCPPDITIINPINDGGYSSSDKIAFKVKVMDYEDGEITSPEQIRWFSDIDGLIGSGTNFMLDSLTKNKKHTISVEAKDSSSNISSASIFIWYDMPARITLTTPENGAAFYEDSEIQFIAKGVDSNGLPLASSTYKWYLDGSSTALKTGVASFVFNTFDAGLHRIKVVGANNTGEVSSEDYYFEVGLSLPNITSPASGTRFDPGTAITFTAVPNSTGTLVLNWYLDDSNDSLGTNNTLTKELDVGWHQIRYEGFDAGGKFASSSIGIVVEKEPQIELNYASGSCFFADKQIAFHAVCKDSFNSSIGDEYIKWYYLDSGVPILWQTGSLFYTLQGSAEGQLPAGHHTVRVEAVGPFGSVASKSFSFESGIPALNIEKPISDNSYGIGENIEFEANIGKESLPVAWYVDGTLIHTGSASFTHSFSEGIYTIKAIATDSANISTTDEVIISVGLFPVMDFQVINKKGEKVDPSNLVFLTGQSLQFVGTGTSPIDGSAIDGSLMTWTICNKDGVTGKQVFSGHSEINLTRENISQLGTGLGTIELRCRVSEGFVGAKLKQMYFNLPEAEFAEPASDTFIPFVDDLSETVVCDASGYTESVEPVNYEWYLNWGKSGCEKLDDADPSSDGMQLRLKKGENYLTLIATDSVGQTTSITKIILVDNRPTLAFSPPLDYSDSSAYILDGFSVTLEASGATAIEPPGTISHYKWYLGESTVAKGIDQKQITSEELGLVPGENIVTLTAEDQFGIVATVSHKIYFKEQIASITSPLDNQFFHDVAITFVATGSEKIKMKWKLNGNYLDETTRTLTIPKNDDRFNSGNNEITFGGKDSCNNETLATLNFKYAKTDGLPKIEIKFANNKDVEGAKLFELDDGENVIINGGATGSVNIDTIDASRMVWTLGKEGSEEKETFPGRDFLLLTNANFTSSGNWVVSLTATDNLGFKNTLSKVFYYGYPAPKINLPPDRSLVSIEQGKILNLRGYTSADFFEWWYTGLSNPQTGSDITCNLGRGYYNITYIGTDTSGLVKQDNVEIIVNNDPKVNIEYQKTDGEYTTLITDSAFFDGSNLTLLASATKSDDTELEDSNLYWLKCTSESDSGTQLVAGNKNPVIPDSSLGDGTWYLRLKAEDKDFVSHDFSRDYTSSKVVRITTGVPTPQFIGAVENQRVDENGTITFTVNDISPIEGKWSVDGLASQTVTQRVGDNLCFTLNATSLPADSRRGYHKVYYGGSDSSGKSYSVETTILVDNGPSFAIGYPKIVASPYNQIGTGTVNGIDYSIITSEMSNIKNLELVVSTNANDENTILWNSLSGGHTTEMSSFSRNFSIGSYTYSVTITDRYGIATSTLLSFWVWGYETYSCTSPTCIVTNNTSRVVVAANNGANLVQYNRDTDASSSSSGDIIASDTFSGDNSFTGLCYFNNSMYTLTDNSGGRPKYQKWNINNGLASDSASITNIYDSSLSGIAGFLIKGTTLYISDNSNGNTNKIKLFYLDGQPYVDSPYVLKKPYGITNSNNQIFVADKNDNKIITLDSDGNDEEKSISVTSPTGVVFSSTTNRLYASGLDGSSQPCVYVIDPNNCQVLYYFNVEGANNLAIAGTSNSSDIYITDTAGNRIIRVRSGYSW
ncbi:MAG: hypothetical protein II961_01485 [Candidatus Riflebacteria bacterium]|nr:hypothetical protein [Candidatus Riflebacteria bacterium]